MGTSVRSAVYTAGAARPVHENLLNSNKLKSGLSGSSPLNIYRWMSAIRGGNEFLGKWAPLGRKMNDTKRS